MVFPPELYEGVVQQLQLFESNLSFGFVTAAVTRIRWDEPILDAYAHYEESLAASS